MSPSARREWIEIYMHFYKKDALSSPSAKREWIEIYMHFYKKDALSSPSAKREWIEIKGLTSSEGLPSVSLCEEGVD